MPKVASSRSLGFTLVEIIVGVSAGLIALTSASFAVTMIFETAARVRDEEVASERIDTAAAEVLRAARTCGVGMPTDGDRYIDAFGRMSNQFAPMGWRAPLYIARPTSATQERESARAYIAYGAPTSSFTVDAVSTDAQTFTVTISGDVMDPRTIEPSSDLIAHAQGLATSPKNWLLFAASEPAGTPVWISRRPESSARGIVLEVKRHTTGRLYVPRGTPICLTRAADIMTEPRREGADWELFVDAHDESGDQPTVRGIVDMRFVHDEESGTLKVWILARGDRVGANGSGEVPSEWPKEWRADIPERAKRYRLRAAMIEIELANH